jgi:tRNA dimethylallyltransferase
MKPTAAGRPRFLAVTGPTASGKTELSLALAGRFHAEIISMDSRQLYAGMDIGTDKVSPEARARLPHHGLDLVTPDERYSAGRFARDARRWIDEIEGRGALPLLAGGTGFFLKAVLEPIFAEPEMDADRVEALRSYLRRQDADRLGRWVRRLDEARAELAVEGGPQRMSRTLEVALLTGVPLSRWHRDAAADAPPVRGLVVVLELPREEMDARIDARVGDMVERGLVGEVRSLLEKGYGVDAPGMTGTGYREIARHLMGEATLEEAMEEIRRNTRRYARRQLTWLRHQLPDSAVRVDATLPVEAQLALAAEAWRSAGGVPLSARTAPELAQ